MEQVNRLFFWKIERFLMLFNYINIYNMSDLCFIVKPKDKSKAYESFRCGELRVWKIIPPNERCCGIKANGQQCTRRKKEGQDKYCGTHIKGTPHGTL